jgi:hypothetical protein
MKIVYGIKNFGIWFKVSQFHLVNNNLADHVIRKGYAKFIVEVTQDDFATMIADFKLNGMPTALVKYFKFKKRYNG